MGLQDFNHKYIEICGAIQPGRVEIIVVVVVVVVAVVVVVEA